ncbi:MAG TPA: hypothetical protein DCX27_07560 [Balneola sp.]|nr:hypothetical protein [Balneola sp.]|tara:strand:+ start:1956 stop:2162 length:207 start_codon:yes stop_codon:yes gene_type:complete
MSREYFRILVDGVHVGDVMHDPENTYMGPHYFDLENMDIQKTVDQYLFQNQIFSGVSEVNADIVINTG